MSVFLFRVLRLSYLKKIIGEASKDPEVRKECGIAIRIIVMMYSTGYMLLLFGAISLICLIGAMVNGEGGVFITASIIMAVLSISGYAMVVISCLALSGFSPKT